MNNVFVEMEGVKLAYEAHQYQFLSFLSCLFLVLLWFFFLEV